MTRIMTYNVHSCRGVDGKLDVARIAAVIAQSRPDIVALQELDVHRTRTGRVDQAHAIAERLGMHFHFNAALAVAEERYGDAILTALPVRLVRSGPLPNLRRVTLRGRTLELEDRGALWVEVELENGPLQVINSHLGLVPPEQKVQSEALVGPDWIGSAPRPLILLGDFNATPRYAAYKRFAGVLRDARKLAPGRPGAPTFPSRMPMLRIDHAFVSEGVEVDGVHAPDTALARVASDHLPLVMDFTLTGGAGHPSVL
jgi:endonuclease/exonuclease/phosphatase family metal-dependent hydrolase